MPEFQHVIVGRLEEMAQGDSLYLPGVSPGLNDGPYVAADEARIRPGQFLGTLKSHAMLGADAFNLFMFHSSTNHRYQGNWLIWETVMPPLAQAITGRANEFWYNGRLMPGNPNIGLSGTYSNNDFIYATGNMNSFVLARRAYGSDRLLIMGTHQRTSNMQSSGWKSADVCIDLLPELQFNTRLQGSTYILDTSASPPVFYQLDSWHEWKDPSQWCPHFAFEAEVFDNVPDSVEIRTDRPSGVGTWDFRVFTSYIAFQDTSGGNLVPAYGFCPRDQVDSLRIWVRARNYGTQASDIEFDLDGGAAVRSVSVAADTTWQWYHFNGGSPQVFLNVSPDQHTLTLNPTDTDVQIDKFILLTRPGTMGDTLQLAISGDTVCIGDTVWFSPAGSIPGGCMDYAWDFGDGTTASDTTAWKVYPYAGTYEVTLLARENCSGTSDTSLATVWVVAPEVDAGPDTLVCLGDTLDLQGTATWPYKWRPDPNLDAIVVLDPTVTPPVSQYFYLEAYDPTSGCSAYDSVFVTMLEQRLSYEDTFYICDSASVQLEVLGAYNIVWTPSGSLDDPNAIDPVATPDSTTTYVFQAWDACGCDTITNSVTVFVVDTPQVVAMADTTICDGNAFALTATGLSMYTWNGPAFNAVTSTGLVEVPRFDITQTSQTRNYFVGGTMCGVSVLDTVVVTVLNSPALDTARVIPGQRYQEPGAAVSFDIAPTGLPLFSWTPAAYLNNAGLAEPTVTSEVDTTFTLTLTGGNGCVTDYNFDIEWARIQGADTVEFCPGGPVDLQVTPVLFREWFPTAMFPSPYNHTVRIYPDSSGWVFNAYRDLGWPSTLRDSVYLLEIDPPQILTADTTLCYGDTLTLQAIGADEFLWFPTIGLSDSLVSNPLLTATQSEIYRVMNCEVPYCFAHDSVEIRVDSVPLSATLLTGNQSLCPGDSVQLFATGANQYTWTPGASLDSASISAPTAGPALTTTYTVAMSNSGFCFVEDSLIVAVDTAAANGTLVVSDSVICPGDTVTLTASGGTFYTWTSSVGGNVINGSNGAVQTAAPANDATYYVSVSNGGACPWQDSLVVVDTNCCDVPGTTLRFSPRASSWTGPTSGGNYHIVDTFRVDTNIFFFNTTFSMDSAAVIYVEVGDTLDTQGCHFIAACNGMWEGIVLESAGARLIGKTDTLAQAVRAVAAHGGASFLITNSIFEANYIGVAVDSSPTLPSYPGSILSCTFEGGALLPPMDTAFASYAGIKVEHVRGLTIGTSGFAGVAPNKFAELEYGVHVLHSDVRLYHNAFGNLQRRSTIGPVGGIAGSGTAIYSNAAGAASFAERLVVGLESGYSGQDLLHHANTFDSCHYGVHARGSQDVFIRGNEMDSLYGYGIFVTRLDGDSLFIERNTIEQSPLGVFAGRIRETEAKIYENTIFGDRLNARHGMRFDYVFYPSLNQVDSTYKFNVTHNDIRVQGNAIWMVNVDHLNVQENYVGVKLPSAGTPVGTLNGVYLAAASGPNRIMSNDIQSEASTWEVDSLVQVRGVYVEGSPETVVNCNDVRDIGRCIEWRNSCNPSDMHKNLMINAVDGLSLRDFGEIGPQGDTLRPSDNRWQGSNFTNSQTQSEGSIGEDSKFFVRWSPTYYPGTNTGVGSPNIPVAFDSIASTSFETLKCSERGTGIQVLNSMMNIIQNRYSEGSYVDVTQFNADHWVIRAIVRDSAYLEEDSLIQDFWDTYEDSAITSVVRISEAIAELNASQASDLLGSYTPDCVIEENLEDVFDIELDLLDSDLGLDNTESETLENLAELCPLVGGIAVHRARSLLSMAEDLSWDYDDCSSDSKARLSNSPEPESVRGILEVWPNPANEDLNIRFKGQLESGSKVQVIDGHGRILMQEAMPSHSEILRFATRGWSDGLYSVRLLTPTGRSFMGKVVIFHR
ncbi:MAG: PKD domain-containing protein [Bacteroidota bacterium]